MQQAPQYGELTRALGLVDCAFLVIWAVIGSGIFLTPSNIARTTQNDSALLFVWVLGWILSFCGALAFMELGGAFPRAGGYLCLPAGGLRASSGIYLLTPKGSHRSARGASPGTMSIKRKKR